MGGHEVVGAFHHDLKDVYMQEEKFFYMVVFYCARRSLLSHVVECGVCLLGTARRPSVDALSRSRGAQPPHMGSAYYP